MKKPSLGDLTSRKPSSYSNFSVLSQRNPQLKSPPAKPQLSIQQPRVPYFKSLHLQQQSSLQDSSSLPLGSISVRSLKKSQPFVKNQLGQLDSPGPTSRHLSKGEAVSRNGFQSRKLSKKFSLGQITKQPIATGLATQRNLVVPKKRSNVTVAKQEFIFLYIIGVGGFGRVWKVQHQRTSKVFAMKEMNKALIITKTSVGSVMNERKLLSDLKHPFLVNMHFAFQDKENLYLVMDYMLGGDLRYHIGKQRRFPEQPTRFFIACIIAGLSYLHNRGIVHRDIKPENLVMDEQGYVHITDLGIARLNSIENRDDTSGTPGYMAPEVMLRQPQSYCSDFFALGVIAYEFMMGKRPYPGRSRNDIRDLIIQRQAQIKRNDAPTEWSNEALDFINRVELLQRKPSMRLGFNGISEIKCHPWFDGFEWTQLEKKQMVPPFQPPNTDENFDQRQIYIEDQENTNLINQNIMLLKDPQIQGLNDYVDLDLFEGYEFAQTLSKQAINTADMPLQSGALITVRRPRANFF